MNVTTNARLKTTSAETHARQPRLVLSVTLSCLSVLMLVLVGVNVQAVAMAAKIQYVLCMY